MHRNARAVALVIGWALAALIVWLSLTPSPPELGFRQGDKLGHFGAYALLMFWFALLYRGRARSLHGLAFLLMGLALEFAQGALGFRLFDLADVAANAAGIGAGWALAALLSRKARLLRRAERETL